MTLQSTVDRSNPGANLPAETEHYVLGGGPVGELVSRRLIADGHTAVIVDESYGSSEIRGHRGDPANVQTLKDAGLSETSTVIVATANDRRNLLIAQLARAHFDVSRTIVLVNHPDRYEPLADAGHQTVCATTVLTDAIVGDL